VITGLPVDPQAELTVAGCAVVWPEDAAKARSLIPQADVHDQRLWHLIVAAAGLPAYLRDGPEHLRRAIETRDTLLLSYCCEARVDALVDLGYERSWLVGLVVNRSAEHDANGYFADRIRKAARARREVQAHMVALAGLGVDVAWAVEQLERFRTRPSEEGLT
jgi:hypothetical protein